MRKNIKAFSLAEVLITLAILGVVAMLTVPHIQHSYKERITVTKVKKFYANLDRAYDRYKIDNRGPMKKLGHPSNGNILYRDDGDPDIIDTPAKFIQKYMDVSNVTQNGVTTTIKLKDGTVVETGNNSLITFHTTEKRNAADYINGKNTFLFSIIGNNVLPYSLEDTVAEPRLEENEDGDLVITPAADCAYTDTGCYINQAMEICESSKYASCSSYIIRNGNMNYLHPKKGK